MYRTTWRNCGRRVADDHVRRAAGVLLVFAVITAVMTAQPRLEILPVHVGRGLGGNTTVQIGPEGALVVDAQPAALSEVVLDAVRSLTQPMAGSC